MHIEFIPCCRDRLLYVAIVILKAGREIVQGLLALKLQDHIAMLVNDGLLKKFLDHLQAGIPLAFSFVFKRCLLVELTEFFYIAFEDLQAVRKHYKFGQVGRHILPDLQIFHDREIMLPYGIQ